MTPVFFVNFVLYVQIIELNIIGNWYDVSMHILFLMMKPEDRILGLGHFIGTCGYAMTSLKQPANADKAIIYLKDLYSSVLLCQPENR